jgi:hypothetical protein
MDETKFDYTATHTSAHDGSDAMVVAQDEETITLVNEDGFEWTDPRDDWVSTSMVEAVKAHALEHYEDGGWDVVVECWDDEQIAEQIAGATTVAEAVAAFAGVVSVWADQQADARNSAF